MKTATGDCEETRMAMENGGGVAMPVLIVKHEVTSKAGFLFTPLHFHLYKHTTQL
jgi:hypothetical protein